MIKRAILIDGSSLIYRCFYALDLRGKEVVGDESKRKFMNLLLFQTRKWINLNNYAYGAMLFDIDRKSFRTELLPEYKANRDPMPQELLNWLAEATSKVSELGMTVIFAPKGYEADDLAGTISKKLSDFDFKVDIFTTDKDFLQLVTHLISIYRIKKSFQIEINNHLNFAELNENLLPFQIPLFKALTGDSSDNYPGIPQIGAKTAQKIINQFKTEKKFFSYLQEIKEEKIRNSLLENVEQIKKFLKISRIKIDLDYKFELSDFVINK
ncbi:5'-3' exonuclease [Mycoplasma parvum]|uniref:5'-3' exonuclease n=1 Tax=Mycoplasma parvum str. Indiana TaxID=1403316 RepID=U5NGA5_9MOLU|nr:5'-3' exonuclease H3TH domain-containing protein [Mycoplasma parvum]AGX89234.1 hypothetical protein PRV_02490 [Mycoplasma parvum str. Indiana]